jgi:hypothetical protein
MTLTFFVAGTTPALASYPLDALDRSPPPSGKPSCSPEDLVRYRGEVVRYATPVMVHPAFVSRLARFEQIAQEVAIEIYGRAPKTLHHGGAYACRTMPSGRYSEHAFGNALDLEGFEFAAAGKGSPAFRIRVTDGWREKGPLRTKQFFARLLERLDERDDVFRAIVGPPDPSHTGHLHLDAGRWSYSRYAKPRLFSADEGALTGGGLAR